VTSQPSLALLQFSRLLLQVGTQTPLLLQATAEAPVVTHAEQPPQ
jgi:hypothetical protein